MVCRKANRVRRPSPDGVLVLPVWVTFAKHTRVISRECRSLHPQVGVATPKMPPLVHITVEGLLTRSLDLTEPATQRALRTNLQELTGAWRHYPAQGTEAPTQTLGPVCHQTSRFDGIRYPSSKNLAGGVCLAVFPDRLQASAYLKVYDPYGNLAQSLPYGKRSRGSAGVRYVGDSTSAPSLWSHGAFTTDI